MEYKRFPYVCIGDFGGHNDSVTLSALPSATNSLSGGLKPLSDEEEANDHKTAEELVKKSDSGNIML